MPRIQRIFLSILSGVLLSLPWLGLPAFFVFIGFVPLFFLNNCLLKQKAAFARSTIFQHSFLSFFIWNVLSAWWMAQVSFAGVISAMLLNALLMSGVFTFAHFISRNFSNRLGTIAFIALWISLEFLQFSWDMEWPCLQLGSILAKHIQIIQWYEFTGAFGGSLWVLLLNVFIYRLIIVFRGIGQFKQVLKNAIVVSLFAFVPTGISLFIYFSYIEKQRAVTIAIVQPNVDPYTENFDRKAEDEKLNTFIELAGQVVNDKTDLLIGPETLFEHQWMWNEADFGRNEYLLHINSYLRKFKRLETIFGISSFTVFANSEEATITAQNKDGVYYDRFNTALFLNSEGETRVYHKSKLVAGVEKTPFLGQLPFFKKWILDLGGASGNLGRQNEATNFITNDTIVIAPVICFESVFGEYVASYVKKGAQIVVVITNDGWWKNSRGYKQHLLFSQLRAIETRRSIARAANTGTSCFINQLGGVVNPTKWWEKAAISGEISVNNKITFYVKYGDYIARGAVLVSVFLLIIVFLLFLKNKLLR